MAERLSRRTMALASAAGASFIFIGCKPHDFSCDESLHLSAADKEARRALNYQDRASEPSLACKLCRQFVAGDGCGSCKLMAGPVHPLGTCKIFTGNA